MSFEIVTYLVSTNSPEQLLNLVCSSGKFTKQGIDAVGQGAIVETDLTDPEEASFIKASLGIEPTTYLRYILQKNGPPDSVKILTLTSAKFLAEHDVDGAVVYPMGEVILTRSNGKVFVSKERKDLVDDLGRIFKEPLQVKDPITL